jgi:hypothetical protein
MSNVLRALPFICVALLKMPADLGAVENALHLGITCR